MAGRCGGGAARNAGAAGRAMAGGAAGRAIAGGPAGRAIAGGAAGRAIAGGAAGRAAGAAAPPGPWPLPNWADDPVLIAIAEAPRKNAATWTTRGSMTSTPSCFAARRCQRANVEIVRLVYGLRCDFATRDRRNSLAALADSARHLQKTAEAHPAAADRLAVERILRKSRQEARDRDGALEPRQRHAGALMRARAEGQMPVRRTADTDTFGHGALRGVADR